MGLIELEGRETKIKDRAVKWQDGTFLFKFRYVTEVVMNRNDVLSKSRRTEFVGTLNRIRISIDHV